MKSKTLLMGAAVALGLVAVGCQQMPSMPNLSNLPRIGGGVQSSPTSEGDDITGTVTGPRGPEAGVWVIAETRDLPTKFWKIVVTDDQGRYAIPDLPKEP